MSRNNPAFDHIEDVIAVGVSKMSAGIGNNSSTFVQDLESPKKHKRKTGFFKKILNCQCLKENSWVLKLLEGIVLLCLAWTLLYVLLKGEMLPSGGLFKMISLVVTAYVAGCIVSLVGLPPLLGMLLTGICFKSIHFFEINGVYKDIVVISRDVALTVILIKGGLGLEAKALKEHYLTIVKLSLCPCVAEAITAAAASHFIFNLPWLWGLLLGFLLSPISPAVVVPTLLSLKERGYGEDKGISTLVIAASSIDDIFSISLFGIFLSLIFNGSGDLTMEIIHGPLELVLGIGIGLLWGLATAFIPQKEDDNAVSKRSLLIGLGGLVLVLGSKAIGFSGSGPLAAITSAFFGAFLWSLQTNTPQKEEVMKVFSGVWLVMQPILFGFIGTEIDLNQLELKNVSLGLAVLGFCLLVRVISCMVVLIGSKLSWKECVFVNLAWLPKATVQAALSAQALELVQQSSNPSEEDEFRAKLLLTTAVLAILITAPIGSIGISFSGTRLLTSNKQNSQDTRL